MAWQEDLQQLDADLAAGHIDQREHRRKRDDLLAEASGGTGASPVASPRWQSTNPGRDDPPGQPPEAQATEPRPTAPPEAAPGEKAPNTTGQATPTPSQPRQSQQQQTPPSRPHQPQAPQVTEPHTAQTVPPVHAQQTRPQPTANQQPTTPAPLPGPQPQVTQPVRRPEQQTQPVSQPVREPDQQQAPSGQVTQQQPLPSQAPYQPAAYLPGPHEQLTTPVRTPPPTLRPPVADLLGTARPTSAPSPADANRTEALPYPAARPAGSTAQYPFPPSAQQQANPAPARQVAPPPAQQQAPPHARQQMERPPAIPPAMPPQEPPQEPPAPGGEPEVPAQQTKRRPSWIFVSLALFVVLTLIIGGAWWLSRGEQQPAAQPPPSSQAPPPEELTLEEQLPALPGTPAADSSTMSVAKGAELGLYSPEAGQMFTANGATEVIYRGSSEGPEGYLVLVLPTTDARTAETVVGYLAETAVASGLTSVPVAGGNGVTGRNDAGQLSGYWYASAEKVVTVWVSQPLDADAGALAPRLERTVGSLGQVLPATR
ncbi:hypothetical protein [Amycolatopsis antarctica]|nr:hypothetical protein [Amycolatopsis antarctica]